MTWEALKQQINKTKKLKLTRNAVMYMAHWHFENGFG